MIDSCSIEPEGLMTIDQALQKIQQSISVVNETERVILKQSTGRILAEKVVSSINIPPHRNSAMDGYAFCSLDIKPDQSFELLQSGISWAGKPYQKQLQKGECIRIFTGAVVPDGADSIIMQEQVKIRDQKIIFPDTTQAKQYIREAGSDINKHSVLLAPPKVISAIDTGLLASAGIYDLRVKRKLNIAFFSTGDELLGIGQKLEPGQIYDSNRYTLHGLLNNPNHNIFDLGVVPDNKEQMQQTLLAAASTHDVILTSGSASVGDADYIKEILDDCGEVLFWKIAMKPGKPLAFGKIKDCYFFGLPGNPVSVISTFHKIVKPALQFLTGIPAQKTITIQATCMDSISKETGRQEYMRGLLSQNEKGDFIVQSAGKQGSNIMSAMSKANCYIVLPIESKGVIRGQRVRVEPFDIFF